MQTRSKRKAKRPSVSVVGSGRLGAALAGALASLGYTIEAVVTATPSHARKAAKLASLATVPLSARELGRLPASQLILITTPDAEILKAAKKLAKLQTPPHGRTVLHTSGALSSAEVLEPLAAAGFAIGSLHPLVSISSPTQGIKKLRGAFYCVEGDDRARRVATSIVRDLGGRSFQIDARHKPLYHAAAVMASGHVTVLVSLAVEMLVECGLDNKTARQVLLPLLESTVANLVTAEPSAALTGPFARGDLDTVKRHLRVLSGKGMAKALSAYKLLGQLSLDLAKKQIRAGNRKRIQQQLK